MYLVLMGSTWKTFVLVTTFDDWIVADSESREDYGSYSAAWTDYKMGAFSYKNIGPNTTTSTTSTTTSSSMNQDEIIPTSRNSERSQIVFFYVPKPRDDADFHDVPRKYSALDSKVLNEVRDFEEGLRNLDGWKKACYGPDAMAFYRYFCDPGLSILAYVWPSVVPGTQPYHEHLYEFDARGKDMLERTTMLAFMQTTTYAVTDPRNYFPSRNLPFDVFDPEAPEFRPDALRSLFRLTTRRGQEVQLDTFVPEEVLPYMEKFQETAEYVDIYIDCGSWFEEWQFYAALLEDCKMIGGCVLFVLVFMYINTGSTSVSSLVVLMILISVVLGYCFLPSEQVNVTSLFSFFLMLGIGADFAFVFLNFWKVSVTVSEEVSERLAFMLVHSGKACLLTTVATSASFFANMANGLRPLREFGFFIGACVVSAFLLFMTLFPSIVAKREAKKRRRQAKKKVFMTAPDDLQDTGRSNFSGNSGHTYVSELATPKTKAKKTMWVPLILVKIVNQVAKFPLFLLCGFLGLIFLGMIMVINSLSMDFAVPQVYHDGHNHYEVDYWRGKSAFGVSFPGHKLDNFDENHGPTSGAACVPGFHDREGCIFFWCNRLADTGADDKVCWEEELPHNISSSWNETGNMTAEDAAGCAMTDVRTQVVSPRAPYLPPFVKMFEESGRYPGVLNHTDRDFQPGLWQENDPEIDASSNPSEAKPYITPDHTYCPIGEDLTTVADCEEAARGLGKDFSGTTVDEEHKYCIMLNDGRDEVYFNINGAAASPTPPHKQYASICKKAPSILEPLELPYVYEDWETGNIAVENVYEVVKMSFLDAGSSSSGKTCNYGVHCNLVGTSCNVSGWRQMANNLPLHSLTYTRRLDSGVGTNAASSTSSTTMPPREQRQGYSTSLTIAWGVAPIGTTPLMGEAEGDVYRLDPFWEPSNPWAQRSLMSMCRDVPKMMDVGDVTCWLEDFSEWQYKRGGRFPTRKLDYEAGLYQLDRGVFIGWNPDPGYLVMTSIKVKIKLEGGLSDKMEQKRRWDDFMDDWNSRQPITAGTAIHVSSTWQSVESDTIVISSSVETVLVAAVCAFVCVLFSTRNVLLSFVVVTVVLCVIVTLLFIMISIMGWALGPIELISLIVFVGYAVTYPLHVAHSFIDAKVEEVIEGFGEEDVPLKAFGADWPNLIASGKLTNFQTRHLKVSMAIYHIGGAILCSALSTAGASLFLFFCEIRVFFQLGFVLMTVTVLALVAALVTMPAILLVINLDYDICAILSRQLFPPDKSRDATTLDEVVEEAPKDLRAAGHSDVDYGAHGEPEAEPPQHSPDAWDDPQQQESQHTLRMLAVLGQVASRSPIAGERPPLLLDPDKKSPDLRAGALGVDDHQQPATGSGAPGPDSLPPLQREDDSTTTGVPDSLFPESPPASRPPSATASAPSRPASATASRARIEAPAALSCSPEPPSLPPPPLASSAESQEANAAYNHGPVPSGLPPPPLDSSVPPALGDDPPPGDQGKATHTPSTDSLAQQVLTEALQVEGSSAPVAESTAPQRTHSEANGAPGTASQRDERPDADLLE
jgi:hypothetical protein